MDPWNIFEEERDNFLNFLRTRSTTRLIGLERDEKDVLKRIHNHSPRPVPRNHCYVSVCTFFGIAPCLSPPKLVPASDFQFFGGRKMIDERKMSEKKKVQIRIEYRVEQLRKEKRKKK